MSDQVLEKIFLLNSIQNIDSKSSRFPFQPNKSNPQCDQPSPKVSIPYIPKFPIQEMMTKSQYTYASLPSIYKQSKLYKDLTEFFETTNEYEEILPNDLLTHIYDGLISDKKEGNDVQSIDELFVMLLCIDYWGIEDIPFGIIRYFMEYDQEAEVLTILQDESIQNTIQEFGLNQITKNTDENKRLAITLGKLSLFITLLETDSIWTNEYAIIASKYGHLSILKYIFEHGCHWDEKACESAAEHGKLDCLQYLIDHGCPWEPSIAIAAAKHGHLQCLQYIHKIKCPWSPKVCSSASESGHLQCLQFAYENGCPWNQDVCYLAASKGHLQCLQYAHEQGCSWDKEICDIAAHNGHLLCLKYAHEKGCSWDEWTCYYATSNNHLNCLIYLHEHGCPWNRLSCYIAAKNQFVECLEYLQKNGCPWDDRIVRTNMYGMLDYFKFLYIYRDFLGLSLPISYYLRQNMNLIIGVIVLILLVIAYFCQEN